MSIDFSSVLSEFCASEKSVPTNYHELQKRTSLLISNHLNDLIDGEYIDIDLGPIGRISYPFYKYKNLTSLDLFSADVLFQFSRYLKNYPEITEFIDIGANIGLHSVVAKKIGYTVISFEPDPDTVRLNEKCLAANKIKFSKITDWKVSESKLKEKTSDFLLVQAAVSDFDGISKFCKIVDYPTASFLSGRKQDIYGEILEEQVRVVSIERFKSTAVIKMDAEGEDAKILQSILKSGSLTGVLYLGDWRHETRQILFDQLKQLRVLSYNPFLNKEIQTIHDLPPNKSCDFITVTLT